MNISFQSNSEKLGFAPGKLILEALELRWQCDVEKKIKKLFRIFLSHDILSQLLSIMSNSLFHVFV